MTAPVVDLGLPTDQELSASTAPDPIREADRLTGTGNPGRIGELARAFTETGTELDDLHRQSRSAQQRLAAGFQNDRTPVYDEATHRAALPPGFRDAGTQLHALGRRLGAVSAELHAAIEDVNGLVARLHADLVARRRAWQAELGAIGESSGQLPPEAVTGLLARRATVAAQMQEAVSSCGRSVVERVDRYNDVLRSCLRLLDEFQFRPPDTSGTRLNGLRQSGAGTEALPNVTPLPSAGAGGPRVEIYPLPDGRFEGRTDHPPAPVGPAIDVAVPGPPPDTRTDHGQLPLNGSPGIHLDADADPSPNPRPEPEATPPSPPKSPIAESRTIRGNFPRVAGASETLVRRDEEGQVTHYQVYGPDGQPVKRVDLVGRPHGGVPTPHVVDYRHDLNPATGETFVSPNKRARPATPEETFGL